MEPTDLIKKIDDAMEDLPEEVRSFLFDGEFDAVFESYKKDFSDQEKFLGIKNKTVEFVLGVSSIEDLKRTVENCTENKQLLDNLKKDIQEKVIDEILLVLDVYKDMENNSPDTNKTDQSAAPTPSDMLARLNQTMTTSSTLTPTKRTYTETPPINTPSAQLSAPSGIKSIDPYREIPEK